MADESNEPPVVTTVATIGLNEIYNLLQEVRFDVRDLKKELGELSHDSRDHELRLRQLEQDTKHDEDLKELATGLNARLSAIEKKVWGWGGAVLVLSALASYVLPKIFG